MSTDLPGSRNHALPGRAATPGEVEAALPSHILKASIGRGRVRGRLAAGATEPTVAALRSRAKHRCCHVRAEPVRATRPDRRVVRGQPRRARRSRRRVLLRGPGFGHPHSTQVIEVNRQFDTACLETAVEQHFLSGPGEDGHAPGSLSSLSDNRCHARPAPALPRQWDRLGPFPRCVRTPTLSAESGVDVPTSLA